MASVRAVLEYADTQLTLIEKERRRIEAVRRELEDLLKVEFRGKRSSNAETCKSPDLVNHDVFLEQFRKGNESYIPSISCETRPKQKCPRQVNGNCDQGNNKDKVSLAERQKERMTFMTNELAGLLNPENTCFTPPKEIARGKKVFPVELDCGLSPEEVRRQASLKYKEELEKQIEEKKLREAEERREQEYEDRKLERKIEMQRQRMLDDYYREQERLRRKTDDLLKRQELVKESQISIKTPTRVKLRVASPPTEPRSPSYLHVKLPKAPLIYRHTNSVKPLEDRLRRQPMGDVPPEPHAYPDRLPDITSQDSEEQVDTGDDVQQTSQMENNFKILARLAEVRKKMQEDHMNMMKQLKMTDSEQD
ncbi:hypothetical protein HDE_09948 [Halotydeus destructor]|nr:hypothetical protein HDE_09948 [Halotydeus destructor]